MTDDKKKTLKKGLGALLGEEISSIKNADSSMANKDNISPSRFQARTDISEESREE